jgi:hypothetical protein
MTSVQHLPVRTWRQVLLHSVMRAPVLDKGEHVEGLAGVAGLLIVARSHNAVVASIVANRAKVPRHKGHKPPGDLR